MLVVEFGDHSVWKFSRPTLTATSTLASPKSSADISKAFFLNEVAEIFRYKVFKMLLSKVETAI